ncbi:hypothetical protein H5410_031211 [Solanum commersonii]|uniref:Uncharacterized protein n=1 Tax=Solanum commersonii TaxID=4109 RepID=A0A9J5YHT5_SOLCO|nr:hypothetical protein H5410_031211 [Solanum commersonii]
MDYYKGTHNKIESHEDRLRNWLERIRNLQPGWEYMTDLDIGKESWCTSKCYAWRNVVSHMAYPSVRVIRRFVDNQRID